MTSDPALSLRVSRLENDTQALYELVTDIKTVQDDHTRRLDGIDTRLDGIDTRLDGMDARFDGMDARFDGMDARFDGMDARFDGIDSVLAEVLRRLPEPS
ncbi:hypothetical protein NODU109028_17720 [Nocardioides dubius]|uniref:t-SNARE coiled-coil homology domain-containing protein n=1 Tax=Nocardioides dubius TaxID=317019 RepID=A0ABP4E319_9ACTN